jgi:DNA adenine methylase
VNFFDILRTRTADLVRAIELTPYSKAEYFRACEVAEDPLERARRFYIRSWQSRGGPTAQWRSGWRYQRSLKRSVTVTDEWQNTGRLQATAWRLKQVQIENADALKVMTQFDTSQTLFYVDPPYVPDTRNKSWDHHAYRFEMDDAAHRNLARSLHELEGMVILSGYPSPLYDELFADWQMHTTQARTQNLNKRATECLWLSPRTVAALGGKQMSFHMGEAKAK